VIHIRVYGLTSWWRWRRVSSRLTDTELLRTHRHADIDTDGQTDRQTEKQAGKYQE